MVVLIYFISSTKLFIVLSWHWEVIKMIQNHSMTSNHIKKKNYCFLMINNNDLYENTHIFCAQLIQECPQMIPILFALLIISLIL